MLLGGLLCWKIEQKSTHCPVEKGRRASRFESWTAASTMFAGKVQQVNPASNPD